MKNDFVFQMVTRTKKIFVGGLSAPSTLEDVKNYFEQFGKVNKVEMFFFYLFSSSEEGGSERGSLHGFALVI